MKFAEKTHALHHVFLELRRMPAVDILVYLSSVRGLSAF